MSRKQPSDLAASVRQRLLNLAKARGEELQLVLTRYGIERLLYRLGRTPASEQFVLKGAVLFYVWEGEPHRPTRDVDFLGYGDSSPEAVAGVFRAVCEADVEPDGLTFLAESVAAESIRDAQEYGGARLTLLAMLGNARIPLQVDVGFGDTVIPPAAVADFPTLLDFPAPRVRAYPAETVVAEKFQAMVALGIANTRMKDFYDVWMLSETRRFEGARLAEAIAATFSRRGTALPSADAPPLALTEAFGRDADKQRQWKAFLARGGLSDAPTELQTVLQRIAALVMPPASAARRGKEFHSIWASGRDWTFELR
ncbi:MAG: nucleotidyl transferase AbiEii/AbiGii toxin family protein [Gemmatimonadaceae bacterium]|nr:nucleotidyl transferase AbiEii/AbiGii toxin family protein [Gemmatimonadaceae bacterium]